MPRKYLLIPALLVMLAITLPFLIASALGGMDTVFMGFLLNPADGATYLAKMQIGMAGKWRFTLPYTAETSPGAYVNLFYIVLGHIARIFGLEPLVVFHAARIASAALLLYTLVRAVDLGFRARPAQKRLVYWLLVLGGGMGWTAIFLGYVPMDFWVAEAYPFLSMLVNPHFPLGLALLVWIFLWFGQPVQAATLARLFAAGALLAIILPFAMVVAVLVGGIVTAWDWFLERKLSWQPLVAAGALGGPLLLYQYAAILADPLLNGWNQQNLTPTPPVWDLILSFSPVLVLALLAAAASIRSGVKLDPLRRVWVAWVVTALLLAYLPLNLQRRFLLGLYIPLAFLAVDGLVLVQRFFAKRSIGWMRRSGWYLLALSLPSTVLLLAIALGGAVSHSSRLYLSRQEVHALQWIENYALDGSLVLASPDIGGWLPALTGRRVIYGHPFETVNAAAEKPQVQAFFAQRGWTDAQSQLLAQRGVDYIFYGPRERALGGALEPPWQPVFENSAVRVFQVP